MNAELIRALRAHIGLIVGLSIGLLSGTGLFGAVFGLLVGLLVDEVLRDRLIEKMVERMYADPQARGLPGIWTRAACLIGISGALVACRHRDTDGTTVGAVERAVLARRLNRFLGFAEKDARLLERLVECFFADRGVDPGGLAARLVAGTTPDERAAAGRFLVEVAAGEDRRIVADQRRLLTTVFACLGLAVEEVGAISAEVAPPDLHPYRVLGVSPGADVAEVRRVYRTLAAQFHPDRATGLDAVQREQSAEAFLRINKAYNRVVEELVGSD